ncbi:MAG: O-methyltransferase [Sedimentisphaerales bacterium]|nr:O-methyltransferase [Sedimentisphaerales bacterium]
MVRKIFLLVATVALLLTLAQSLSAQRMGRGGGGNFGTGMQRGGARGRGVLTSPQSSIPLNEQEKKILGVLDDMYRNQSSGMMNVPTLDGRILRMLAETTNAQNVIEIGTSNGYSGIWFCLALKATGGKLITHDIDEGRASLARENFKRAGVDNIVTLVMGDAHETVKNLKEPIDILFLDADKEGYLDYLNKLMPLVRPGGLILAHNIDQVGRDFINAITANPNLETVQLEGVTVTLKKRQSEQKTPEKIEISSVTTAQ